MDNKDVNSKLTMKVETQGSFQFIEANGALFSIDYDSFVQFDFIQLETDSEIITLSREEVEFLVDKFQNWLKTGRFE